MKQLNKHTKTKRIFIIPLLFCGVFFVFSPVLAVETCCLCEKTGSSGTEKKYFPNRAESNCKETCKKAFDSGSVFMGTDTIPFHFYPYSCDKAKNLGAKASPHFPEGVSEPLKPSAPQEESLPPITPPTLQINIPTVKFSEITDESGGRIGIPYLADYIAGIYKYAVSIASIIAIVMIMVGGLIWLTAGGSAERVGKAKETITGAAIGLLLLLGSYTILYAINPDLVSFKNVKITILGRQGLNFEGSELSSFENPPTQGEILCRKDTGYKGLVQIGRNELPGVTMTASEPYLTPDTKEALRRAGAVAAEKGYSLSVYSACRSLEEQQRIANENPAGVGKFIAVPGKSMHGTGRAIDVLLSTPERKTMDYTADGKKINGINSKSQCQVDPALIKKLSEIMVSAGFLRYEAEIWHFEYGTNKPKRGAHTGYPSFCKP